MRPASGAVAHSWAGRARPALGNHDERRLGGPHRDQVAMAELGANGEAARLEGALTGAESAVS